MSPDIDPIELRGTTVINIDNNSRRKLKKDAAERAVNDSMKDVGDYLEDSRIFKVGSNKRKSRLYNRFYYKNIPTEAIEDHKLKNKIYNEYENGDYLKEIDRELSNFENKPLEEYYTKSQKNNEKKYREILTDLFQGNSTIINGIMNNLAAENRFNGNEKQIGGSAIGYFQMEPGKRMEYNRYLKKNNLKDSFRNEVLFFKRELDNSGITNKLYLIDDPSFKDNNGKDLQAGKDEDVLKNIGIISEYGNVPTDSTFYNNMKQFVGDSLAFRKNAIVESRDLRRKYEDKYGSGKVKSTTYRYVGLPLSSALGILNNADNLTDRQAAFLFNIGFERAGKPNEQLR